VSWSASAVDGTHDPPSSYTLQYRVTGGGAWTRITGITETTQFATTVTRYRGC
jgi:hypothetical protein